RVQAPRRVSPRTLAAPAPERGPGHRAGDAGPDRCRRVGHRRQHQCGEAERNRQQRATQQEQSQCASRQRLPFSVHVIGPMRPSYNAAMLVLIQRASAASVTVDGETVGAIGPGLLALVGIEPGDGSAQVEKMARRLVGYRVFADGQGRMNLSLADTGGGLLLVSQFTLAADTSSGLRPGFSTAMAPAEAERIF